jgi:hypothetical protein
VRVLASGDIAFDVVAVPTRISKRISMSACARETDERFEEIESCNSRWIFDTVEKRFLRLPRQEPRPSLAMVPDSAWETYVSLTVDPVGGEFVVKLNDSGSRILRSQRHIDPCPNCESKSDARQPTMELRTVAAEEDL